MENKIIETKQFKVIVTNSKNKELHKLATETEIATRMTRRNPETMQTEIYLNTDYYNTPEALAYGLSEAIFQRELNDVLFYEVTEEEALNRRGHIVGEELIDLLKQLR